MIHVDTSTTELLRLKRTWSIIGAVLLAASIVQPIVSSFLSRVPPEDLLAPMQMMTGGAPLPDRVEALFAGMFANIEFALAFAAVKLVLGAGIVWAARGIGDRGNRGADLLSIVSIIGIAAFSGIGAFFAYSAIVIAQEMSVPLAMTLIMVASGLVIAFFPARWLWSQFHTLRRAAAPSNSTL